MATMGLCVTVDGTMSKHDGFGVGDEEISFFSSTPGSESGHEGIATFTLDEFTKILGYMVATWVIPRESRFARLLEGIRAATPSLVRDGAGIYYEVPASLYSGPEFMRGPGMHVW